MLLLLAPLCCQGGECRTPSQQCGGWRRGHFRTCTSQGSVSAWAQPRPRELLQDCGSSSICTPGVLQANDETVGSPGPVHQGHHWDFIHLMAPGHKKFNIFFRKFTCRDLKRKLVTESSVASDAKVCLTLLGPAVGGICLLLLQNVQTHKLVPCEVSDLIPF